MDINLVKNVINGVNLVKIGHFLVKMTKIWSFWGPQLHHRSKFGEGIQKISSLKFIQIISVRFMDINLVKNAINGGKFCQNRSFFVKMLKIGSFSGEK